MTEETTKVRVVSIRPSALMWGAITVLFVIVAGLAIVLSSFNETLHEVKVTVHKTDTVVSNVTGPAAQERNRSGQAAVVKQIVDTFDCVNQRNLQRLLDALVVGGVTELKSIDPILQPQCKLPP